MASDWHKKIKKNVIREFEKKGFNVKKEKSIGFEEEVTRETRFKQVDVVAEKGNETILIEIEDIVYTTEKYGKAEYGVGYVELGGILSLSHLYSKLNPTKNSILILIFRVNIRPFRKKNIERIIDELKTNFKKLKIEIQYRR